MDIFPSLASDDVRNSFTQVFAWIAAGNSTSPPEGKDSPVAVVGETYPSPVRAGSKRPEECVEGQKIRDDLISSLLGEAQNTSEEPSADLSNKVILGLLNQLGKTSELLNLARKEIEATEKENRAIRAELAETMRLLRLSEEECLLAKNKSLAFEEELKLRKIVLDKIHAATEQYVEKGKVNQKP